MANVVFDERSAARIAAVVKWAEQFMNVQDQLPEPEEYPAPDNSRRVIKGTFSGEWPKNTAADVEFTADNGSSRTKSDVFNYFTDVGSSNGTTDCVIMQAGTEWVLVSADPVTECVTVSAVEASGNLTLLTGVSFEGGGTVLNSISGSVVTSVACVDGNLTVQTADLASFASTSTLEGSILSTTENVAISDLLNITTTNITVPKQGDCE